MTCFVGIDIGLDGAVAALLDCQTSPLVYDMPTDVTIAGTKKKPKKKRSVNGQAVRRIVAEIMVTAAAAGESVYALIERAQLRPAMRFDKDSGEMKVNQGVASQALFMEQAGLIRGILIGLGVPHEDIHPATWKKDMFHGASEKADARSLASSLFPAIADKFERVKDDGRAEAILIAEYLRRRRGAPF